MTAAEFLAEREADPKARLRRERNERERERRVESVRRAAAPVVADLRAAGFEVDAIGDLVKRGMRFEAAVPVLVRSLARIDDSEVKESIVRALTVPWAKPQAAPALLEAFPVADDPTGTGLRWAIANALTVVADDSVLPEVAELAQDRSFGRAREMLPLALANMRARRDDAIEVLGKLLDDEEVAGHAVIALGKLKAADQRAAIVPFLRHPKSWVREEAKQALARIDA